MNGERFCKCYNLQHKTAEIRYEKQLTKLTYPVVQIQDIYPGSKFFPSRIRIKELKYFNPKNCFQALGNMIRVVHFGSGFWFLPIPDPGVKKAPDHGTGSATRNISLGASLLSWQDLPDPGGKGGWALAFHFVGCLLGLLHEFRLQRRRLGLPLQVKVFPRLKNIEKI